MADQPITHKSTEVTMSNALRLLETSTVDGVKCDWSGYGNYDSYYWWYTGLNLSWNIDWSVLKVKGVDGLSGHIIVTSPHFNATKIDIDTTENIQKIEKYFQTDNIYNGYCVTFEYSLIPHRSAIGDVCYDEMFLPSVLNDTILVIDGKKLNVNKVFLSYHSDFFRALFSSNFKEGQMDEIQIKEISYEDFGLVMSTIYPKTQFPSDKTMEKLLELADRFIIPSVIGHVEYHLLHNSLINNEKKTWMADAYDMPKLLEKCLCELNTLEKAKKLKISPEYKKLSNDAKAKILDRVMELI